MADLLLDLRPPDRRALNRAAEGLRFAPDTQITVVDKPDFGLVVTYTGRPQYWAPFESETGCLVAVAGRVVFDAEQWDTACAQDGRWGLAARVIHAHYGNEGVSALERLNGNFGVVLYDPLHRCLHLVRDRAGVFPVYEVETAHGPVYGSHPDVLADVAGEGNRLDEISLADFVLSGTVTPPFSFYERVRALEGGTVLTAELSPGQLPAVAIRRYFEFSYRGRDGDREEELAADLATALRSAIQRRTLPRLGPTAVALSGGLDSRIVLEASLGRDQVLAFCCYDTPNRELSAAEAIAGAVGARFLPLQRGSDYYADNAEEGVRISGGMGTFANNHFLGMVPRLKGEGIDNLLTGCYADYLFKALPLNRQRHWLTGRDTLGPFRQEFYFDHFTASTPLARRAWERREQRIPPELRLRESPEAVFGLEARRTFPLCSEGDNQQRLVPQRVAGWCPPFADNNVLDVYCRIPYQYKLNRSLFRKVVRLLATESCRVPDANTGCAPDAFPFWEWVSTGQMRLRRALRRIGGATASDESWPNWHHYVRASPKLNALWRRPSPRAIDVLTRILGASVLEGDVESLKRDQPFLFVSMLSAKIWLDQRG